MTGPRFEDFDPPKPVYGYQGSNSLDTGGPTFDDIGRADSLLQRGFNALNNFRKIAGSTHPMLSGLVTDEEKAATHEALNNAPTLRKSLGVVMDNLRKSDVSFSGVVESADRIVSGAMSAIVNDPVKAAKTTGMAAVHLPVAILSAATVQPLKALFGVNITEENMSALTPEDRAQAIQGVVADGVAAATGVGTSKLLGKAHAAVAKATVTGEKAFNTTNVLNGRIGRAITDDVIAASLAGMTQGAVSGAGSEDQNAQVVTGLLFAPLGVATGYIRSLRGPDGVEQVITEKADLYRVNQLQKVQEGSVAEIHAAANALISSDNLAQAVIAKQLNLKDDAIGVVPKVEDPASLLGKGNPDVTYATRPNKDGTYDVLFWGKGRTLNQGEIDHWVSKGSLPTKPDGSHVGLATTFHGQPYFIDAVVGDNVRLKDLDGNKITVPKALTTEVDSVPKEFLPRHYVDRLYNEFDKDFLEKNPTLDFNSNLINFATKHNLQDKLGELSSLFERRIEEYARKVLDPGEVAMWDNVKNLMNQNVHAVAGDMRDELMQAASNNGLYVNYEGGKYVVKEHGTMAVIGEATNSKDALGIVNGIGARPGPTLTPPTVVPTGVFTGVPPAHARAPFVNTSKRWGWAQRVDERLTRFDAANPSLSSMVAWTEGVDQTYGTNFKTAVYNDTQAAARATRYETARYMHSPRMNNIRSLMRSMTPEELEDITAVRESMTYAEMLKPGGLAKNDYKPSALTIRAANQFAKDNIRFEPVLKTRRALFELDQEFGKRRQEARFKAEQLVSEKGFRDRTDYLHFKDQQGTAAERSLDGEYQTRRQDILTKLNLTPEEHNAIKTFDAIAKESEFNIYAATRMARALLDPKISGRGRADLMADKGWRPGSKHAMLIDEIDRAYDELAKEFQIEDWRKFNGFVNHYREWGDNNDPFGIDKYLTGIESDSARKFASSMIRTGELENIETNAADALEAYVRAGYKSLYLYPALDRMREQLPGQLAKITDAHARKRAFARFVEYEQEISGQKQLETRAGEAYLAEFLGKLGVSREEMLKAIRKPDGLDTVLSLTSSGLMGARPMMAIRDWTDVVVKYYTMYGLKRTKDFMFRKVSKQDYEFLKSKGVVDDVTFDEFYNPGIRQEVKEGNWAGITNNFAHSAAEIGFQTSFQPHVFKRAQAATYMEQRDYIRDIMNDFMYGRNGLDSKEKLYKKLRISKHDDATIAEFDARISSGNAQSATEFLAREETRFIAGVFGLGNHPSTTNKWGRLFNQMGMWSISNRSIYNKMLFRGDKDEVLGSMMRYMTAQGIVWTAGRLAGVNMASWLVTPSSFIFTGGPAIQLAKETIGAGNTLLGGDDNAQRYASQEAKRSAYMLIPFGYAARDWQKAYELSQWADPQYTVLQALGFKVSEQYMFDPLID